jgi:hypothetical protein
VVIAPALQESQFAAALHMLEIRHLIEVRDGSYRAVISEHVLLRYYANTLPEAIRDLTPIKPGHDEPAITVTAAQIALS